MTLFLLGVMEGLWKWLLKHTHTHTQEEEVGVAGEFYLMTSDLDEEHFVSQRKRTEKGFLLRRKTER